jgi:hypothetical protein
MVREPVARATFSFMMDLPLAARLEAAASVVWRSFGD